METNSIGTRIRQLRTNKGMSQEALADESGLSHRTIQRIESGENSPTGDTIRRLASALEVAPNDLIDWGMKEDRSFLIFLNLAAYSFLVFPIMGILIPTILWVSKKDKVKNANEVGSQIINFQITWVLLLVLIPVGLLLLAQSGVLANISIKTLVLTIILLYLFNAVMITINIIRLSSQKPIQYWSFFKFLKA